MKGLLMCRVSSQEQAAEGYSLNAQEKLGDRYAEKHSIEIVRRWVVAESAKKEGRAAFNELLAFAKKHRDIRCILFEKPDRMSRNFFDLVKVYQLIEEHDKEVHFFKTGQIISRESSADDFMRLDIDVVFARRQILLLKQETKKGVLEKAEQGWFPGLAPCGYRNNKLERTIEVDPDESRWVRRAFELMRTRLHSLEASRQLLFAEGCPTKLLPWKSSLEKWIRNVFYYGAFLWDGKWYQGKHTPLVSKSCWDEANAALSRLGKSHNRQGFPYGNMMDCFRCGCSITAERHKKKSGLTFDYYRCTWRRGKCGNNAYYPEREIEQRIAGALKGVQIDSAFADWAMVAVSSNAAEATMKRESQIAWLKKELADLKTWRAKAYDDRMSNKITEDFWNQKDREWGEEIMRKEAAISRLEVATPSSFLPTARRLLELQKRLEELFFSLVPEKRRLLVNCVCLNLRLDENCLYADYQTPFKCVADGYKSQNLGE